MDGVQPEMMLTFYRRLYPFNSIFAWLNQAAVPTRLFTHREFSFTLPGDVYLRYHSFNSADELKKQVCALNPTRFEIGPVYSARPRDKKIVRPGAFNPQQRELVFDIDMTDYDPIRTCCSDAEICSRCWAFISAAVRVLHGAIKNQYGFQHLLWVYSGRRGIHLWISDKEAMELTDEQRKAIVGWLTVIQGGKERTKQVNVRIGSRPLPPSVQSALDVLKERFSQLILDDQDCFASNEGWETLLKLIPDSAIESALRKKWTDNSTVNSAQKWADLKKQIQKLEKNSTRFSIMMAAMEDIVLQYTYPRLDAEVSKHRNHLLKAPFCVHPKTGRVCVPVDPEQIERFDPEAVPTVDQLLRELDESKQPLSKSSAENDWERTSLKPFVEMLDRHARGILNETRWDKRDTDTSW